jgi:hypothetical protein
MLWYFDKPYLNNKSFCVVEMKGQISENLETRQPRRQRQKISHDHHLSVINILYSISFCFNSPQTFAPGMQRYMKPSANTEKLNDRLNEINDPTVRSSLLNGGFLQIISRNYGATPWWAPSYTSTHGRYWTAGLYLRVRETPVNIQWRMGSSKYITSYHPYQLPRPHDNHSSKSISPILVTRLKAGEFNHHYFDSTIQAGRGNPNRYFEFGLLDNYRYSDYLYFKQADLSNRLYSSSLLFAYVSFQLHNA